MVLTPGAREAMLEALEPQMGAEVMASFLQLLPRRPWREVVPSEHWLRPELLELLARSEPARALVHDAMGELIGEEHAATLMEYLAPAPWGALDALGVPIAWASPAER
ncbi:MAG: hypothetical protein WD232_01710 [Acidimicrobiales bacterium]